MDFFTKTQPNMKNNLLNRKWVLLLCVLMTAASCTVVNVHSYPAPQPRVYKRIPPGHEKRRYGDQSARRHAPGHQKKHGQYKYKKH